MKQRDTIIYWAAFAIIMALLIVAPLVLPEFWRRFLTEILIWGLPAMSSDVLIGYTGMVSFGHSAFFGLGMYGAAAALLMVSPPNLPTTLVGPNATPADYLRAAQQSLQAGRTGEAQQALEMAETRLLDR